MTDSHPRRRLEHCVLCVLPESRKLMMKRSAGLNQATAASVAQRLLVIVSMLLAAGCATLERPAGRPAAHAACLDWFETVDGHIQRAGLRDEGASPVAGFPYLRSNRLLAALADRADEGARLDRWLQHLGELDANARHLELQRHGGPIAGLGAAAMSDRLDACRQDLLARDRQDPARIARLRQASQVPDDYVLWWRVAGLYPLTAPIYTVAINRWHRETRATFATPLDELAVHGRLQRWAAAADTGPDAATIRDWLAGQRDPLGLPQLDGRQQQALFARFAPIWEVDVVDDNDRIGQIRWHGKPQVDTARPAEYRRLSYALLDGQVVPQLNYQVWFPSRPKNGLYAGWLDGLVWRVTIGPDGEPWLYDSIHPCGCYHLFFPGPSLQLRQDRAWFYVEKPLSPQQAPAGERLVIRVESRRHYIQRVHAAVDRHDPIPLQPLPYDHLRALPESDGSRYHSLFGRHGLVAGSERPERFLIWPMGIRSPGAMRQSGRQATAFVGRRHFDDPYLIESLFRKVSP